MCVFVCILLCTKLITQKIYWKESRAVTKTCVYVCVRQNKTRHSSDGLAPDGRPERWVLPLSHGTSAWPSTVSPSAWPCTESLHGFIPFGFYSVLFICLFWHFFTFFHKLLVWCFQLPVSCVVYANALACESLLPVWLQPASCTCKSAAGVSN